MLTKFLKELLQAGRNAGPGAAQMRAVLNVGGNSKKIPIPPWYDGWKHVLLDIDARANPDLLCDARNLSALPPTIFDAVYCSHNLEHYYRHDGFEVLRGFRHVLKDDGFVEIVVPDLEAVIGHVINTRMDLDDTLYVSPAGPITPLDVIYGLAREIEESGQDFFAHKTGFTPASLHRTLQRASFVSIYTFTQPEAFEVRTIAFKSSPNPDQRRLLDLPETD
jgi:hypothetical protein